MATRNVLVSVVGDRDPLNHELFLLDDSDALGANLRLDPGPILETIHLFETDGKWSQQPLHKVWLLFTDDKSSKKIEARVQWLCSYLQDKGIEAEVYDLQVANPSDYSLLIPSMSLASSHIRRDDEGAKFFILTSPGTPQMSATWIVLGNEGRLAGDFLQKVPGKRAYEGAPGKSKVVSRQDDGLLLPISLSPFFEHEKVEQIAYLLEKHMAFSSCSILLNSVAKNTLFERRRHYYDALCLCCDLVSAWENNDYEGALRGSRSNKASLKSILDRIDPNLYDKMVKSLALLNKTTPTAEGLTEYVKSLLARAAREHFAGDYASCVTYSFSAYETLLAGTLRNPPYHFRDSDQGKIADKEDRLLGERCTYGNNRYCLGASPKHAGMERIKPRAGRYEVGETIPHLYTLAISLRETRNNIIHKNFQVGEVQSRILFQSAKTLVSEFLEVTDQYLEDFPYTNALGTKIGNIVRGVATIV